MRPTGPPPLAAGRDRLRCRNRLPLRRRRPRAAAAAPRHGCAVCSRRCRGVVELEEADPLVHRLGLLLQRLGGRGILLDQRRVLLRDLVHLGQRLVDLLDAGRLLGAGVAMSDTIVGHLLDRIRRSR